MFNSSVKTLAAAAILFGAGTSAFAATNQNTFDLNKSQPLDRVIKIDTVNASSDGEIAIYSYKAGARGELIGSASVRAGRVENVNVLVAPHQLNDALVVLTVNDQEVHVERIS